MPKVITIGYGERAGYDPTPAAVRDAADAGGSFRFLRPSGP
jgi:hypothetical protein